MENPYQSPLAEITFQPRRERHNPQLDDVASGQKLVISAILIYFAAAFVGSLVPALAGLMILLSSGMSWVGIYRISRGIAYAMWARIAMMIMVVIPLIGLLVLLRLNNRATSKLKEAGYSVGLMGARGY